MTRYSKFANIRDLMYMLDKLKLTKESDIVKILIVTLRKQLYGTMYSPSKEV